MKQKKDEIQVNTKYVPKLKPENKEQSKALKNLESDIPYNFLIGPAGTGKAQPLDAKIKIPGGWKLMGDIILGDIVSTPSGDKATVTGIFPQGSKDIYRVTFTDGRSTECCEDHLWEVYYPDNWGQKPKVLPLKEIKEKSQTLRRRFQVRLPDHEKNMDTHLPIDPYVLGCLLGDGGMTVTGRIVFTTADECIVNRLNESIEGVFKHKNGSDYDYIYTHGGKGSGCRRGTFGAELRQHIFDFGLFGKKSHEKFIPDQYLYDTSKSQKIKLLQGLLDTDGYAAKKTNSLYFTSTSEVLCEQVQYLVRSIGGTAKISSKNKSYTYKNQRKEGRLAFTVVIDYKEKTNLVTLERKKVCLKDNGQYIKTGRIGIDSIEYVGKTEAQCIMIDSEDHLYITDDFIVTHNTLFATVYAIKKFLDGTYKKIVITRPAVSVDEDHGFLPGDLTAKMHPWMLPIIDVFMEFFDADTLEEMIKEGVLEIAPLAYMRGRNLGAIMIDENSDERGFIIIADEIQNSTPEQMKMLLTRLGKNSKMIITGDLTQHDRGLEYNGLGDAYKRINNSTGPNDYISIDHFNKQGVVRSVAVQNVLNLYPEDDE